MYRTWQGFSIREDRCEHKLNCLVYKRRRFSLILGEPLNVEDGFFDAFEAEAREAGCVPCVEDCYDDDLIPVLEERGYVRLDPNLMWYPWFPTDVTGMCAKTRNFFLLTVQERRDRLVECVKTIYNSWYNHFDVPLHLLRFCGPRVFDHPAPFTLNAQTTYDSLAHYVYEIPNDFTMLNCYGETRSMTLQRSQRMYVFMFWLTEARKKGTSPDLPQDVLNVVVSMLTDMLAVKDEEGE